MKLVDLSYFPEKSEKNPLTLLQEYEATSLFLESLSTHFSSVTAFRSQKKQHTQRMGNVEYIFTPEIKSSRLSIPVKLHQQIRFLNPEVILVHGWMYPLQVIHLRKMIGSKCIICVQHHAEKPASGLKKWIQSLQFNKLDATFFTCFQQAKEWFSSFEREHPRIFELAEGSSPFRKEEFISERLSGKPSLLSVANLDENKDPITLLLGFSKVVNEHPHAALHLVYKKKELELKVKNLVRELDIESQVIFHGEINHANLGNYYSNADYFVSASRSESTGFAVIEAISCGCIPVVTRIPGHQKSTDNGYLGALWEPGNADDFAEKLNDLMGLEREKMKMNCVNYFDKKLSYESLADQAYSAFLEMKG